MTPKQIDSYLAGKGSPLAGLGTVFVREGKRNHVDPMLLVAISGAESAFGTDVKAGTHNPFGWGPHIPFKSWEDGIATVARGLNRGYLSKGLTTIAQIGAKWAPSGAANDPTNLNSNWTRNVSKFYRELSGAAPTGFAATATPPPAGAAPIPSPAALSAPDLAGAANRNLSNLIAGKFDPVAQLATVRDAFAAASTQIPGVRATPPPVAAPAPALTGGGITFKNGAVKVAPGADRQGVSLQAPILTFAAKVAGVFGKPLTITTGTNHNQFVKGSNRESAHWTGYAADIAASGKQLTRMGQAALVAAGADPAWARKQPGGLFNIGGRQIIFNTDEGGNHYNHLHIGIRR